MRRLLTPFFSSKVFYSLLLVINMIGVVWGFIWYGPQYGTTPFYLWPFLPNSPLAVLYFFIALLYLRRGRHAIFWEAVGYFGLIKHGLWTVAIITAYHLGGNRSLDNVLLWTGHLGMALQAIAFWYYFGLPLRFPLALGIAAWYAFNDYLDYVVGIYPRFDTDLISLAAVRGLAVSYTIILALIYLLTAWQHTRRKDSHAHRNP